MVKYLTYRWDHCNFRSGYWCWNQKDDRNRAMVGQIIWIGLFGCVWKCRVPLKPVWFCWWLSLWKMAISLGILTQHFQTNPFDSLSPLFVSNTYSPCQSLFRMGKVLMYNEKVAGEQDIPRRGRGMSEQWTMDIYMYIYIYVYCIYIYIHPLVI